MFYINFDIYIISIIAYLQVMSYSKLMQVEGLIYKVPEIIGIIVAFVAIIVVLLSVIYYVRRRSYSIKSQRSPLDVSRRILHRNNARFEMYKQ